MIKNTIVILSLILLINGSSLAQTDEFRRQEEEDRIKTQLQEALKTFEPDYKMFADDFLPSLKDAWMIAISRSGGITGRSAELTTIVNSAGYYSCGLESGKPNLEILELDALTHLDSLIKGSNLKSIVKSFSAPVVVCNDCIITQMEIDYRHKENEKLNYALAWNILPESATDAETIYEGVLNATSCP